MDSVSLTIEGDAKEANGKAANGVGGKGGAKIAEALPIPSPATTERLAGLCRVWGAAKYFHPWLAYKNIDWDGALVAAIPKVRAATNAGEYKAAVDGLLAALHDPATHTLPMPGINVEAASGNAVTTTPAAGKTVEQQIAAVCPLARPENRPDCGGRLDAVRGEWPQNSPIYSGVSGSKPGVSNHFRPAQHIPQSGNHILAARRL